MSNILNADPDAQSDSSAFADIPTDAELKTSAAAPKEPTEVVTEPSAPQGTEVPDKFKDKSVLEVIESYKHLEKELGSKQREVGDLRSLTDQLLANPQTVTGQRQVDQYDELPNVTADDVLNDPRSAIESVVSGRDEATNSRVDALEATLAMQAFAGRHPTFKADQTDSKFQEFVTGSNYRQSLAQKAASGSIEAADELWGAYDEVRDAGNTVSTETQTPSEQAALESATSIARSGGADTGAQGPKPISRLALARIKLEDEERYLSPEFQNYMLDMYRRKLVK
jgi:hypothetical protein